MQRLALVTGEFPPQQGGVGDYTRELATALAQSGVVVRVITSRVVGDQPSADPVPALRAEQGEALPHRTFRHQPFATARTNFASLRSLAQIDRLTRDCDLVHIQYQAAAYGMTPPIHLLPRYLRWRDARRKVVVTFHDLKVPYLFPKAGRLRWRAITLLAQSCDAVIVTNQEDYEILKAQLPTSNLQLPTSNLQSPVSTSQLPLLLIPIGSNIDANATTSTNRDSTRASLGVQPDETLLCYFGFLNASKGGETLVRVLANVVRAGYNARLLMLGGKVGASDPTNAAYAQRVKALIGELALSARVIWAGYRPAAEVSALWRASDIAVLPYADGASLRRGTLMAALAHAMPIVSTTPRVPVPLLRDGENIALAPPDDADALAAQVIALIASPALRERLSQGAAQLAQAFSWASIAAQHLELYQLIASG